MCQPIFGSDFSGKSAILTAVVHIAVTLNTLLTHKNTPLVHGAAVGVRGEMGQAFGCLWLLQGLLHQCIFDGVDVAHVLHQIEVGLVLVVEASLVGVNV